LLAIEFGGGKV